MTIQKIVEPRIYSIILISNGVRYLYSGICYSLDEAYSFGRIEMLLEMPEFAKYDIDIEMWTSLPATKVIAQLSTEQHADISDHQTAVRESTKKPITVTERRIRIRNSTSKTAPRLQNKNSLMQKIIEEKNIKMLNEMKGHFTDSEYRFIIEKIKKGGKK